MISVNAYAQWCQDLAAACADLADQAFTDTPETPWTSQSIASLSGGTAWLYTASDGKTLLGFAILRWIMPEAELLTVAVRPGGQQQGLATRILQKGLDNFFAQGGRAVFLEVRDTNEAARRLYQRLGFAEIDRRKNYYAGTGGRTADALILRLDAGESG